MSTETARAFCPARARGEAAGILGLLTPDAAWTEAEGFPYYGGTWRGPDAVRDNFLARLPQDWDGFAAVADDFVAEGTASWLSASPAGCRAGTAGLPPSTCTPTRRRFCKPSSAEVTRPRRLLSGKALPDR